MMFNPCKSTYQLPVINSAANGKDYYQMLILLEIVVTIIHKQGRNLYYIDNKIFKMYSE